MESSLVPFACAAGATLAAIVAVQLAAAVLASAHPARASTRIEPVEALRTE